ncbi:MAG: hypothetical protein ACOX8N_09195 [Christensenellales bacterium]
MMTRRARRANAASEKKRLSTRTQILLCAVLFIAMAALLSPVIAQAMAKRAAAGAAAQAIAAETGMIVPFLRELATASRYSYDAVKTVSGMQGEHSTEFSCAVQDDNFVVQTEVNQHRYRQLYVDGSYTLVDDTLKTVQPGVCKYDYMDGSLISAISGRVIRTAADIIDGINVTRVEIYKDGFVYAYYLNPQGVLVRFYYIYDGNEVTLDISQITLGSSDGVSFDVPSGYSVR